MAAICNAVQRLTFVLLVSFVTSGLAKVKDIKVTMKSIWDLVEGDSIKIPIVVNGNLREPPDIQVFNKTLMGKTRITNTTDPGRIWVVRTVIKKGIKAKLTIVIGEVKIQDQTRLGYSVTAFSKSGAEADNSFQINVLPKKEFPIMSLSGNLTGNVGSEVKFLCNGTTVGKTTKVKLAWFHIFKEGDQRKEVKGNASVKTVITLQQTTSVLTVIASQQTGGMYICEGTVIHKIKQSEYKSSANANLTVRVKLGMEAKKKIKVFQKKDAKLECLAMGYPVPKAHWKMGGKDIDVRSDARYRFSKSSDGMPNGTFEIKDVEFKDRAIYTCVASNVNGQVEVQFTLRVRDLLGPLWPFIGIIIEAIVLALIIFVHEKYKDSKQGKRTDKADGEPRRLETSPLLINSGQPGVAYTVGKFEGGDGVKIRDGTEEKPHA